MNFTFAEFKSIVSNARQLAQQEAKTILPCVRSNGCAVVAYSDADGYETIYWKGTKRDLLEIVEHFKAQGVEKFTMQGSFDGASSVYALNNFEDYEPIITEWAINFTIDAGGNIVVTPINEAPAEPESFASEQEAKAHIKNKLDHLREKIELREWAGWTPEQSEAEADKSREAFALLEAGNVEQGRAMFATVNRALIELNNDYQLEGDLTATQSNRLMVCPKRYVVTEAKRLQSPAGFHPEQRVFLQTTIAIHTDDVNRSFPATDCALYGHDIDKMLTRK